MATAWACNQTARLALASPPFWPGSASLKLRQRPEDGRHGSWLNLIEGFFSKFTRSVLRHIRVASKQELKERIMAGIKDINRHPVIHTWPYKLAEAA